MISIPHTASTVPDSVFLEFMLRSIPFPNTYAITHATRF